MRYPNTHQVAIVNQRGNKGEPSGVEDCWVIVHCTCMSYAVHMLVLSQCGTYLSFGLKLRRPARVEVIR